MWRDYWDDAEEVATDSELVVKDCHWALLANWDTVAAIKDLKVKWWVDIKRWDKFKNIRLTDNAEEIESGKMVLRTEFFKKV
jgi:alkylphosphonate utilization operon protein PhnA